MDAKAGQDKLEWSFLDVEQEEWERRLADLGAKAVYATLRRATVQGLAASGTLMIEITPEVFPQRAARREPVADQDSGTYAK